MLVAAFEVEDLCFISVLKCLIGRFRSGSDSQTANQLVPESNQTSRMSVSLRNVVPPQCAHFAPAASSVGDSRGVPCLGAFALEQVDDLRGSAPDR